MTVREVTSDDPTWHPLLERVVAAASAYDGVAPLNEEALLALGTGGLEGALLYVTDHAFALVRNGGLDLVVAPEARGRGAGAALLAAVGDGSPLVAWSHADHPAAAALSAAHGFRRARELRVMHRAARAPEVPPTPEGVVVRTFLPGDEDALLAANAAAFADHPEQGHLTRTGLDARMAEPWFDATGLFLAFRAGVDPEPGAEVLGFHWTKVHPDGAGEVYVVGVTPAAQGLGLGRHLTSRGLAHLSGREVLLYVEADNTLAIALYDSLEFEPVRTEVQYTRR